MTHESPASAPPSQSSREEIVIECDLPDPPHKVWRALTVPELLAAWLLEAELAPALPHPDTPDPGTLVPLHVEPQQRVSYLWSAHEEYGAGERFLESRLDFELTPAPAGGTHLRIVHSHFRESHIIRMCAPAPASAELPSLGTYGPRMQGGLQWAA